MKLNEIKNELRQFTGTTNWYRHGLHQITYTDGIKYLVAITESYWLIDLIASYAKQTMNRPFLIWRITKYDDNRCTITARENTNEPAIIHQKIDYSDFPGPGTLEVYQCRETILLKSEY